MTPHISHTVFPDEHLTDIRDIHAHIYRELRKMDQAPRIAGSFPLNFPKQGIAPEIKQGRKSPEIASESKHWNLPK